MTKTNSSRPRKLGGIPGMRALILAAAVAGTLGLWALFAKIERDPAAAAEPLPLVTAAPLEVTSGEVSVNLPPIPTLVPALPAAGAPLQPAAGLLPAAGDLPAAPTPPAPLVFKPIRIQREAGARRVSEPRQPAASTRSSR